jgi:DNA polymerase-3 subunit beta
MKFKIDKDHFANGLTVVNNIVGNRAAMPILNNVLIEAEGETVAFTATNLDTTIRVRVKATVNTGGSITLPAKKLLAIVSAFPEKEVTVEIVGQNSVKITSGSSVFKLMGIATDSFPRLATFSSKSNFALLQKDLAGLISKVDYAQSSDENRFMLNGVYFNFEEGKLSLVATDGRRLAIVGAGISETGQTGSLILPAKAVKELRSRLSENSGEVKISFDERLVLFVIEVTEERSKSGFVENIQILSKMVEGVYPNYRQVVPKETAYRIEIERASFADSVRRAELVTGDKNSWVKLKIGNNQVEVTASSAELGEADEKIEVKYEGPEVNIAFNPRYLLDPLDALKNDVVAFEFKDEMSPGVLKTNEDFLCVVMPQRVQ